MAGHAYFSSGTFACRRNAILFDEWDRTESWARQSPGLFAWGEIGMLNYLVHAMVQRKKLMLAMSDLQHIRGHHGLTELETDCADGVDDDGDGAIDCADSDWYFPKTILRPRTAHFCGRKPFLFDRQAYSRPFTIARLEHHRRQHAQLGAWVAVLNDKARVLAGKLQRRFQRATRKLV